MKQLQNDFTTPEQSKRLLELGVPADSADCHYQKTATLLKEWEYEPYIGECVAIKQNLFSYRNGYVIPCWSVGRLIEIFLLCTPYKEIALNTSNLVEQMVVSLFMVNKDGLLDFSKLED